jgi:hypothetical protein
MEMEIVGARYKNARLILLAIAHVSVARSAADVYACVEESPGRLVMADNPEVVCFEGAWAWCVSPGAVVPRAAQHDIKPCGCTHCLQPDSACSCILSIGAGISCPSAS